MAVFAEEIDPRKPAARTLGETHSGLWEIGTGTSANQEQRKVSRVSLVLAPDSTAARTNAGAETHVSRALTSVSC